MPLIVQLLLLYCIVVRCHVVPDIGSTPRKIATDDAEDHSQTITRRLHVDEPAPAAASSAKEIFRTRLESQSPLPATGERLNGGPKVLTDREINTASDVLQREEARDIKSGSDGNRDRNNCVRVAQGEVSGTTGKSGQPFKDIDFLNVLDSLSTVLRGPGRYYDDLDTLPNEEGPVPFKRDCSLSPLRLWACIKYVNESITTFILPGLNDLSNLLVPEIRRIRKRRHAKFDSYYETVENDGAPEIHNVDNDRADNNYPSTFETLDRETFEQTMFKINTTFKEYNEVKVDSGYSKVVDWSRNKTLVT